MLDSHLLFTPKNLSIANLGFKKILTPEDFSSRDEKGKIKLLETIDEHHITSNSLIFPFYKNRFIYEPKLLKKVKETHSIIEIPLSPIFEMKNEELVRFIRSARKLIFLCTKYNVLYILTSRARNEYELKTPLDLISFGVCLGLSEDQAITAISEYPKLLLKMIL